MINLPHNAPSLPPPFSPSSPNRREEMKATFKSKYETSKKSPTAFFSVDTNVGDVQLKASVTDVTVPHGPILPSSFSFSFQKPGFFSIDYSPEKDVKFQFMNSMKVLEKAVDLTYTQTLRENRTEVDGAVAFDAGNKMAVSHVLGTKEWKVRYTYAHGALRRTVIEPCYDVKANAWDFAVTRKFERGDAVKATYKTSSQALGLEWTRGFHFPIGWAIKISASIDMAQKKAAPKLTAESTWTYEI